MARPLKALLIAAALILPPAVGFLSCSSDNTTSSGSASGGNGGAGTATGAGGAGGSGTYSSGVGAPPEFEAPCSNQIFECGDLLDNDNDGLIDSQDPDCLGPCDNTEDSYYPNLPGMTGGPCASDCFWDNGNGAGNDDCHWDHKCDPLEVAPNYYPEGPECEYDPNAGSGPYTCDEAFNNQSQTCYDVCRPLTPNGCDCFGCCELPAGSGKFVWLASETDGVGTCTIDNVNDPNLCKPCTFVPGCGNPCDPCELCLGKTELPDECFDPDGGTNEQCPPELQPCGLAGQDPCPVNFSCITGCCVELPS